MKIKTSQSKMEIAITVINPEIRTYIYIYKHQNFSK